ncbi:hypothetical protein PG985_009737 [Apiospora marii]|uniref:uncharacterized protein n=1 Tax=Apiospora marii TaxID=335849 RepID=UPI0031319D69
MADQKTKSSAAQPQSTVPKKPDETKKPTAPEESDVTMKLRARAKELEAKIRLQNAQLHAADDRIAWEDRKLASKNEQVESLTEQVESLTEQAESRTKQLASKEQEIQRLQRRIAVQSGRITDLQRILDACGKKLALLAQEAPEEYRSRIAELKQELESLRRWDIGAMDPSCIPL